MEKTESFDLAICRLLQEHPLYKYRIRTGTTYRLPILLIGSGKKLDTLRNKLLSNGQLLDSSLEMTVVAEDKDAALNALQAAAPDLKRFIEIQGDKNAVEMACGTLSFETQPEIGKNIPAILDQYADCKYVVISLDTKTAAPDTICPAPGQMVAWVNGDSIEVCGSAKQVFLPTRDDKAMDEILDIAYRLHYAYEKGNDPHITNREIRASFNDLYNYQSNIECALHVRSKIVSAGIDPTFLNSAAEEFAKKMAEDARNEGDLLERLAQLEHRRWCVSKTANGRRCDTETVKLIYGSDGSTTHNTGSSNEWHVALVPYGKDGKLCRRLSEQDWIVEDPETIADLDELDKQTLRVHRQCARISGQKLMCAHDRILELKSSLPEHLQHYAAWMEESLVKMMAGSRDAVFAYRHHLRNLNAQLSDQASEALKKLLDALKQDMGAPIEYLTRKDYKKQNLVLVGSIPFALCGWKSTVLVKLMAESIHECLTSAWQLEPGKIVFVDIAETLEELKQLGRRALQIERFLSRNCNQVSSSYHIFIPKDTVCIPDVSDGGDAEPFRLEDILSYDPTFFGNGNWHLYPHSSLEPEELRRSFVDLMYECGATSIDVTGGKPALISLADGFARNNRAGAFFIRDNRIRNFSGARGMEYQALDKGLSVQQLFDPTDIVLSKREDENISIDFYEKIENFWKITRLHARVWHKFCVCFSKVYRDKAGTLHPDEPLRVPSKDLHILIDQSYPAYKSEFNTILRDLQDEGLLTCDPVQMFYQAACEEIIACLRNSGKILEYYICCTLKRSHSFRDVAMSWTFRHNDLVGAAKNEVDVICTGEATLFISAKNVSVESLEDSKSRNYICYEVGWLGDRFGGPNCRTILAAPNVKQFDGSQRSHLVQSAMNRGVYLLGDRCFEPGNLEKVLRNIDRGREDWCEFLLGETQPACV